MAGAALGGTRAALLFARRELAWDTRDLQHRQDDLRSQAREINTVLLDAALRPADGPPRHPGGAHRPPADPKAPAPEDTQ